MQWRCSVRDLTKRSSGLTPFAAHLYTGSRKLVALVSMRRLLVVVTTIVLAVTLSACSAPRSGKQEAGFRLRDSVEATTTIRELPYTLSVTPSGAGLALITARVSNPTARQKMSLPLGRLTVSDSSGTILFDTWPPGIPGILAGAVLKPGKSYETTHTFDLTETGTWTATLPEVVDVGGTTPLSVQFESVRR